MLPHPTLPPWNHERLQPLLAKVNFMAARRLMTVFGEKRFLVVGDSQTLRAWQAHHFEEAVLQLPLPVLANEATVRQIIHQASEAELIIAIGSGTINDVCKMASYRLGIPYIVCPTALSMNGYLSPTASIESQGLKQSLKAHLPRAVVLDKTVLSQAPRHMTLSGLADVLCYHTVHTDMLWAKHMAGQPYDATPFEWLDQIKISADDISSLAHGVLLSGLGMAYANSSAPASQSEHQVVHTLHLLLGDDAPDLLHGQEVAIATCQIAKIQAEMSARSALPATWPATLPESWLVDLPEPWHVKAQEIYAIKKAAYVTTNTDFAGWKESSHESIRRATALEAQYKTLGLMTTPAEAGWSDTAFQNALRLAPWLRERCFVLDLWSVGQM